MGPLGPSSPDPQYPYVSICMYAAEGLQQARTQELDSSLRRCQEFINELLERSEVWPFRRPLLRREVCAANTDISYSCEMGIFIFP